MISSGGRVQPVILIFENATTRRFKKWQESAIPNLGFVKDNIAIDDVERAERILTGFKGRRLTYRGPATV